MVGQHFSKIKIKRHDSRASSPGIGVVAVERSARDVHCPQTVGAEERAAPATVGAVLREGAVQDVAGHGPDIPAGEKYSAALLIAN